MGGPFLYYSGTAATAISVYKYSRKMNAQECKTLTATRMYDSCTCRSIVASISQCVCLLNIGVLN